MALLCCSPSVGHTAENYALTVGDRVTVVVRGEDNPWEASIDLDGSLRLPAIGQVAAEGMTLDAVEQALEDTISSSGLFVSPEVSVSIQSYAPIIVSGTVRNPGSFEYFATLTVEAAVGLAGGPSEFSSEEPGMLLTARQLLGDLSNVEIDILTTTIRLKRVEAQLEERTTFKVDLTDLIPRHRINPNLIDTLIKRETAILADVQKSSAELIGLRETELAETENQIALLLERRDVQNRLIDLQDEERDVVEELRSRGLQTRMAVSALQRAEFSNEARLLEIETALSQARARRADIARGLTQFDLDQNLESLELANRLRVEIEILTNRRANLIEKSFLIGDAFGAALSTAGVPEITYRIQRRRSGSVTTMTVSADQQALPGDVILVEYGEDKSDAASKEF